MKCENCQEYTKSVVLHDKDLWCWPCHLETKGTINPSAMINPDGIPGGVAIRHGLCDENGNPKTYYSHSEIRKAAYDKGLFIIGDTPKPNPRIVEEQAQRKESGVKIR